MLVFQPQENALFELAGLPFGRVIDDRDETYTIVEMANVERTLDRITEETDHGRGDIEAMRAQLSELGLPEDMGELIAAMLKVDLGEDYDPDQVRFEVCAKSSCGIPFPHGIIHDKEGPAGFMSIASMEQGLRLIMGGLEGEHITAEQGIFLLKQMAAADLAMDEDQLKQRYEGLPEDVRQAFEDERAERTLTVFDTAIIVFS